MSNTSRTTVIGGLTYRLDRHGEPVRLKTQRATCRPESSTERHSRRMMYAPLLDIKPIAEV